MKISKILCHTMYRTYMLLENQPDILSQNIRLSQPEHAQTPPKKRIVSNPASSVPSPPRKRKQQSKSPYKQKPPKKAKVKKSGEKSYIYSLLSLREAKRNQRSGVETNRLSQHQSGSNCQEIRSHQMYIFASLLRRQSYPMQRH